MKYKNFLIRRLLDLYIRFNRKSIMERRLENVLDYCSKNIKYYNGKGSILNNYQVISKENLNVSFSDFCNKFHPIKSVAHTAGTTGTPRSILRSTRSIAAEQYYQNKYFSWNGMYRVILRGEKIFADGENPEIIYKEIPLIKEMYISAYHLSDDSLGLIVKKLNTLKNKCLWTYPSLAYLLADYCLRTGNKVKFSLIATSSEILFDYQISKIQEAFGCEIKDWYGQAERVSALYRCEHGNYHEMKGYSYTEYIERDDGLFEIIGTALHNKIMPLVRYGTNDLVEISKEKCPCGYDGKSISLIYGRVGDYIEINNTKMTATGMYCALFRNAPNISEAQLYQIDKSLVMIKIVKSEKFTNEDEKKVIDTVKRYLPINSYSIEYVEQIERNKNSKFSYVVRKTM